MGYLLIFIYTTVYSYMVRIRNNKLFDFVIYFIPIGTLLVMVLSLQDNVGTDYYSYLDLAEGTKGTGWIERNSEFLFVYLVLIVRKFNQPQLIFFVVGVIQVFFLMLTVYEIKNMGYRLHHFFFLYFTLSLVFFNQFNGIRQYTAVYIVIYALILLVKNKKIKYLLYVIIASFFHSSAILLLFFLPIRKLFYKRYSVKKMFFGILVLSLFRLIDIMQYVELILSYTNYSYYIDSSYLRAVSISGIITKIPKLIIVLYSTYLIDKTEVDEESRFLINLSYLACMLMALSFSVSVIWRFYQYLDFFIIFPVLQLMDRKNKKNISVLISILLFIMFIIKIIVIPQGEYLYRWILF